MKKHDLFFAQAKTLKKSVIGHIRSILEELKWMDTDVVKFHEIFTVDGQEDSDIIIGLIVKPEEEDGFEVIVRDNSETSIHDATTDYMPDEFEIDKLIQIVSYLEENAYDLVLGDSI